MDPLGSLKTSIELGTSLFTTIRDIHLRIKGDENAVEDLKLQIVHAWSFYAELFNIQLYKDVGRYQDLVKSFIICLYEIEDLIDTTLIMKDASASDKGMKYISQLLDQIVHPHNVEDLKMRFLGRVDQWEKILRKLKPENHRPINVPYVSKSPPVGRDVDIRECIEKLRLCVRIGISIIGTLGLGKSLLAETILESIKKDGQFRRTKLVNIKDGTFVWNDLKIEIEQFIEDIRACKNNPHNILIVFDNLLHLAAPSEWEYFLAYAKIQRRNSINIKVIITTRNPTIWQLTFTIPHYLKGLSKGDCVEVIKKHVAFCINDPNPNENMVSAAESVAKYCHGIPWIAQRYGNVIAASSEDDLETLKETGRLSHTAVFKQEILPRFAPCYTDMKPELIRCLAYFSLFPSNYHFDRDDLVHLWLAECFFKMDTNLSILQQCQQIDKYVNDLIERSILELQSSGRCCNLQYGGKEFAMLAASGTCLHLEQGDYPSLSSLNEEVRHLSLSCELVDNIWSTLKELNIKLRTFLSLYTDKNHGRIGDIPMELEKSLSLLRTLSLAGTNVKKLPEFIGKLIHLRYLDVSFSTIEELPTKFQKNCPLQILKIKKCTKLFKWLPNEVHNMTYLRYVDWGEDFLRAGEVPCHIGKVTHLENLPLFRVGTKKGHLIDELSGMDHLQGSISIENLESVEKRDGKKLDKENETKEEAQKAKLHKKCGLRRIILQWDSKTASNYVLCQGTLAGLEPHSNVKELIIRNYVSNKFPEWMLSSVLEKIELKECHYGDLSTFGKMKNLKTLVLTDMESRQVYWRPHGEANAGVCFQKLELMEFHNLNMLEKWTDFKEGDLPCLKKLKFAGCKLIDSELEFIKKLKESNNSVSVSVT